MELSAPIHDDALPGRYRVTKGIVVNRNAEPRSPPTCAGGWVVAKPPGARRETLSFEFDVVAA